MPGGKGYDNPGHGGGRKQGGGSGGVHSKDSLVDGSGHRFIDSPRPDDKVKGPGSSEQAVPSHAGQSSKP